MVDLARLLTRAVRFLIRSAVKLSLKPFAASEHSIVRFAMYRHFEALASLRTSPQHLSRVLAISGSEYLANLLFPSANIITASYPEVSILNLPYPDGEFDAIVADQVLDTSEGIPATCSRSAHGA